MNLKESEQKRLIKSLMKKDAGYTATETQEEFTYSEGEAVLVKRKITTKDVPPDITAIKMLLSDETSRSVSLAELENERERLVDEFIKNVKTGGKNGTDGCEVQD